MNCLTKEQMLGAEDREVQEVGVPEWGGNVKLRSLSATERAEVEKHFGGRLPSDDPGGFRGRILVRTIVNGDGRPCFTDEDIPALLGKSAGVIERLFEAACQLNGFTDKDVEDIEKN